MKKYHLTAKMLTKKAVAFAAAFFGVQHKGSTVKRPLVEYLDIPPVTSYKNRGPAPEKELASMEQFLLDVLAGIVAALIVRWLFAN